MTTFTLTEVKVRGNITLSKDKGEGRMTTFTLTRIKVRGTFTLSKDKGEGRLVTLTLNLRTSLKVTNCIYKEVRNTGLTSILDYNLYCSLPMKGLKFN